jgi:hypothetical protein
MHAKSPTISGGGTIGTIHGVYIQAQAAAGVTTAYGIYQAGASDKNYFAGNIKIGGTAERATTTPTNSLYLFNGTAPAGTLTNGVTHYASSGNAYVMDSTARTKLLTPTYAEIYVADGSTAQSIATGTTYTKLTGFTTNGSSSNCTADASNDKITITKTGYYLVNCSINGSSGTANATFKFAAFLNGTEQSNVHNHRKFTTVNDVGSAAMSGIIDVTTANWDLDIRARHDIGSAINFTPTYMNLTITYLGET